MFSKNPNNGRWKFLGRYIVGFWLPGFVTLWFPCDHKGNADMRTFVEGVIPETVKYKLKVQAFGWLNLYLIYYETIYKRD